MTNDDRMNCTRILYAIEKAGGPDKAGDELQEEARTAKMISPRGGGLRWTMKANVLRRDVLLETMGPEAVKPSPRDGTIVDASIGGHMVRGCVAGMFTSRILRIRHHTGSGWQTLGVHRDDCQDVDPKRL